MTVKANERTKAVKVKAGKTVAAGETVTATAGEIVSCNDSSSKVRIKTVEVVIC